MHDVLAWSSQGWHWGQPTSNDSKSHFIWISFYRLIFLVESDQFLLCGA